MKLLRWFRIALFVLTLFIVAAWACGALYYDGPGAWFAILNALAIAAVMLFVKPRRRGLMIFGAWFAIILAWWLSLRPPENGDWQPDVAKLPWAEIEGDLVTLHNVRNCEYITEDDYTPRWETRTVRLSQLTGADMAITYWGSPYMAHPIVSFQFADTAPVCFSIETRKRQGQGYSAIGGLYRQFSLIYIAADERDVLRVRTNYREGEDVYLYRLNLTPDQARGRFLEYIRSINGLKDKPRWYNAITTNCTTAIRHQHHGAKKLPWDWRILVNGKGDEMLYERGALMSDGLPFAELKKRAHANDDAVAAGDSPDFSKLIRLNRPGMGTAPPEGIPTGHPTNEPVTEQ